MDKRDVQNCARFYQTNYLETFYLVSTYNGKSCILVAEKDNFPHLVGIRRSVYKSNGYRSPYSLYQDILLGNSISDKIIPNIIATNSKMYKKVRNFEKSTEVFWNNKGPLAISYDTSKSSTLLDSIDIILSDIDSGFMLGWKENKNIPINAEIKLTKYCICSWIDESDGSKRQKEKYMPQQEVEIIRNIFAFDKQSNLLRQKEYKYSSEEKENILRIIERNDSNLLVDRKNERYYSDIAAEKNIQCRINGKLYDEKESETAK